MITAFKNLKGKDSRLPEHHLPHPEARQHADGHRDDRAVRAGAHGYITKNAATDTIIDAIRHVVDGHIYASPDLTQRLLVRNVQGQEPADSPLDELSDRELDVFTLIGEGNSTREIAENLKLSPATVETYRSRIRQKLALNSSAQLTRSAVQWVLENG